MDYAFVPGVTPYEDLLKRVMKSRNSTTLVDQAGISTIADFLQSLVTNSHQADNLILGAHASDGSFAIGFDTTTEVPQISNGKDYEMLQAVDAKGTIHIQTAVRTANTNCYLKGCNVGAKQAEPFLKLFKKALADPLQVNAPKFYHILKPDADRGVLEYMLAGYTVMNPTAFDTNALVKALKDGGFTQGVETGGTPQHVPEDKWKDWIPPTLDLAPALRDEKPFNVSTTIVPAAGALKAMNRNNGECSSRLETFTAYKYVTGPPPTDDAARMAFLKQAIQADPRETDGHPFPIHARLGFSGIDAMIKGLTWKVTPTAGATATLLTFSGSHYVYDVKVPVMKIGTNQLIYNYYPTGGTPKMNFLEDNAKFVMFGSV